MEKEYVRELDHTYLIPRDIQVNEDEYTLQMALRGKLTGILPLSITGKDGKKILRADVTACTSIASRYKTVELNGSDLRKILSAIRDISRKMPGLLMTAQDLYLDPECIFLGAEGDEVLVCYIPHISETEPDSVRMLSEFILKHVDHSDQAAVRISYSLFDQVSAESFLLTDVLTKLLADNGADLSFAGMKHAGDPYEGADHTGNSSAQENLAGNPYARESLAGDSCAGTNSTGDYYAGGNRQRIFSAGGNRTDGSYTDHASRTLPGGKGGVYSAGSDFEEFTQANVRKLPPPRKKKSGHRMLLTAAIILSAACVIIIWFRMDLTQILGMGFLCAALIWMIRASLEKRANEKRNIWFDDDPDAQSDDQFYQSLRDELYAEQGAPAGSRDIAFSRHSPYAGEDSFPKQHSFTQEDSTGWQCTGTQKAPFAQQAELSRYFQGTSGRPYQVQEEKTRLLHSVRPVLVSLQKGQSPDIPLEQDHLILGKSRSLCDIILPGDTVSRKHARIERRTDGYYVTDLFSTNGTFLDGHRLESGQAVALKDGAQLTIASLHYRANIPS